MLSNLKDVILLMLRAVKRPCKETTTRMVNNIVVAATAVVVAISFALALDIRESVFEGTIVSAISTVSSTTKRMLGNLSNIIIVLTVL